MSLTCDCSNDDGGWTYTPPKDYSTLDTKKRQRCCSCKTLIDVGAICGIFECQRQAESDIEIKIYGEGEDVYLANWYMCETCTDLFFSLEDLGFCIYLDDVSMQTLIKEYAEVYG